MNKIIVIFFLYLFYLIMIPTLHAQSSYSDVNLVVINFDPALANKKFDQLSSSLSKKKTNIKNLSRVIEQLQVFSEQAKTCAQDASTKIKAVNNRLNIILGELGPKQGKENTTPAKQESTKLRVDTQYLNQQKDKLTSIEAKCQLFLIRANEALAKYQYQLFELQQQITFTRGDAIVKRIKMVQKDVKNIDIPEFNKTITLSWFNISFLSIVLAMVALAFVYYLRKALKKFVRLRTMGFSLILLIFALFLIIYIRLFGYTPFIEETDNLLLDQILMQSLAIVLASIGTKIVLSIRRLDIGLKWYGFDTGFLRVLAQVIIFIYGIQVIGGSSLILLESGKSLKQFFYSIMMIISLLATAYFTYHFYIKHQRFFSFNYRFLYINHFVWVMIFILIALDMIGYNILAVKLANIFYSLLFVCGLSLVLLKGLGQAYHFLNYAPSTQTFLNRYFGYPNRPPHFDLALLKVIIQTTTAISLLYLFAFLIGGTSYFIDHFLERLVSGFVVANYSIKPMDWLTGLLVFCSIVILSRYISRRYHSQILKEEENVQVALASLLLYVGFTIALIMGLVVAGFSFTSLAIIAGALSVGIGLGLQSIVNNFISGLILLIEKPIKAGDRIAIGQIEGFVKKVRVRSTQIETTAKEDIIVPNSDMLTQQVTNFMFRNRVWRVTCSVGVAYGSDTELVKKLLLEVARNHKDVLDTHTNKPSVYFQEFGDSALLFELWCMISDVNKKYVVASDLNFAIDKAFRDHNIVIAFPQRDVHIKYDPAEKPQHDS